MCEALFGVPVFRPGCEIWRLMFALLRALAGCCELLCSVGFRVDEVLRYCVAASWGCVLRVEWAVLVLRALSSALPYALPCLVLWCVLLCGLAILLQPRISLCLS
jgi:hypothetical protein